MRKLSCWKVASTAWHWKGRSKSSKQRHWRPKRNVRLCTENWSSLPVKRTFVAAIVFFTPISPTYDLTQQTCACLHQWGDNWPRSQSWPSGDESTETFNLAASCIIIICFGLYISTFCPANTVKTTDIAWVAGFSKVKAGEDRKNEDEGEERRVPPSSSYPPPWNGLMVTLKVVTTFLPDCSTRTWQHSVWFPGFSSQTKPTWERAEISWKTSHLVQRSAHKFPCVRQFTVNIYSQKGKLTWSV